MPFQSDAITRTLTIQGVNFLNAATPIVTMGTVGLPLTVSTPPTATTITVNFDCSQFSTGTYLLQVSTGSGTPYNGAFYFSFSTQGPAGLAGPKGDPGVAGPQGASGLNGQDGQNGAPGQNGAAGQNGAPGQNGTNGKDGLNGKGHQVVVTKLAPGSICPSGGNQQDFYTIAPDGTMTLFDTEYLCHGNNGPQGPQGNQGANGRDGAPGQNGFNGSQGPQGPQGPAGVAKGWYKKFDSSAITSTSGNVLTQTVTGTPAYLIDAKVNSPFANNAKSVSCTLTALDNGVTTIIDTSDALLIGNSQTTAKGGISLAGVYTASSASASVTISVSCATGGDTRTLTNGRLNVVGANSVN